MCDRSHLSKEDLDAIEGIREFRDTHGRLPHHRAEYVSWAAAQYSKFLMATGFTDEEVLEGAKKCL
jgi:hypothetical protein